MATGRWVGFISLRGALQKLQRLKFQVLSGRENQPCRDFFFLPRTLLTTFLRHRNHPNHLPLVKGNQQAKHHAPLEDRKWASEGQAAALQGEQQQQQQPAAGASGHVRAGAGAACSSRAGGRAGLAVTATSWPRATGDDVRPAGPLGLVRVRGKRHWSPLRPPAGAARPPERLEPVLWLLDVRARSLSLAMTGALRAIAQTRVSHHSEPAKIEADNG